MSVHDLRSLLDVSITEERRYAAVELWFESVTIELRSNDPGVIRSLTDYFGSNDGCDRSPERWTVYLEVDCDARPPPCFGLGHPIELENGHCGRRVRQETVVGVVNDTTNSTIIVDTASRTALLRSPSVSGLVYDGRKTIRNLITYGSLADGGLMLHAACAHGATGGLLFMAERDRGKTTSLCGILATGSFSYIANDKVLAHERLDDVVVSGWPTRMTVRLGTATRIVQLRDRIARDDAMRVGSATVEELWNDRRTVQLEPSDVPAVFNVPRRRGTAARIAVFPDLHYSHSKTEIFPITDRSEIVDRFSANVLGIGGDRHFNFRLFDWLGLGSNIESKMERRVGAMAEGFARSVACYRMYGNGDTQLATDLILCSCVPLGDR